jgi:hypothetical protein
LNRRLSIVSLHTNTWGCGIAKYNSELAKILDANLVSVETWLNTDIENVILSVGFSEFSQKDILRIENYLKQSVKSFILILHSINEDYPCYKILKLAQKVIVLNAELLSKVNSLGFDAEISYTPSLLTLHQATNSKENDFKLFTFGMGHKHEFDELKVLLDKLRKWGKNPTINISSAIHAGSQPLDLLISEINLLSNTLEVPINFLGFLSDEALLVEMNKSDLVFRFFESGIRSNNTTAMTALHNGIPLITNTDNFSPKWLQHNHNFLEIEQLSKESNEPDWSKIGKNGQISYLENADWPGTVALITQTVDKYLV